MENKDSELATMIKSLNVSEFNSLVRGWKNALKNEEQSFQFSYRENDTMIVVEHLDKYFETEHRWNCPNCMKNFNHRLISKFDMMDCNGDWESYNSKDGFTFDLQNMTYQINESIYPILKYKETYQDVSEDSRAYRFYHITLVNDDEFLIKVKYENNGLNLTRVKIREREEGEYMEIFCKICDEEVLEIDNYCSGCGIYLQ